MESLPGSGRTRSFSSTFWSLRCLSCLAALAQQTMPRLLSTTHLPDPTPECISIPVSPETIWTLATGLSLKMTCCSLSPITRAWTCEETRRPLLSSCPNLSVVVTCLISTSATLRVPFTLEKEYLRKRPSTQLVCLTYSDPVTPIRLSLWVPSPMADLSRPRIVVAQVAALIGHSLIRVVSTSLA